MYAIYLLIKYIKSLGLAYLDTETSISFCLEVPVSNPFDHPILYNRYNVRTLNQINSSDIRNSNNEIIGFCEYKSKDNKNQDHILVCLDESFFKGECLFVSNFSLSIHLDDRNDYIFTTPVLWTDNLNTDCFYKIIKIINMDIDTLFYSAFTESFMPFLKDEFSFILKLKEIQDNFYDRSKNGIYNRLRNGHYFLIFFNRDYRLIYTVLDNILNSLVYDFDKSITRVLRIFDEIVDQYLINELNIEWISFFNTKNINCTHLQIKHLKWYLLMDVLNIIRLSIDPEYKFRITCTDLILNEIVSLSCVKVSIYFDHLPHIDIKKISILSDKNLFVSINKYKTSSDKISFYLNIENMIKDNIKNIKIVYINGNMKYESNEISLNEFY
ncbi:hypothetical protein P3W45_000679 [Vairimorpha bombi]|jgi:hypothetical protein